MELARKRQRTRWFERIQQERQLERERAEERASARRLAEMPKMVPSKLEGAHLLPGASVTMMPPETGYRIRFDQRVEEADAHNQTKDELDRVRQQLHAANNRIALLEEKNRNQAHALAQPGQRISTPATRIRTPDEAFGFGQTSTKQPAAPPQVVAPARTGSAPPPVADDGLEKLLSDLSALIRKHQRNA